MSIYQLGRKTKIWLLALGFIGLLLASLVAIAGQDGLIRQEISFTHGENVLKGVLVSPEKAATATPCVIFVHGAGDMPRDAYGYYTIYWKRFADKGWCSLAWDKPGVGASAGDWQLQSMDDRASEVSAAMNFLRSRSGMKNTSIGLIGFSQAGWVMPKVVNQRDDVAFVISVSGAIDWMEQARYSGDKRLSAEGFSKQQIARVNKFGNRVNAAIRSGASYQTYLTIMSKAPEGESARMSAHYWEFVKRNWRANVRKDLRQVNVPVLALFGAKDAYVDPIISARIYRQELKRSSAPFFDVITFDNADHALMLSDKIQPSYQGLDAWILLFKILFWGEKNFPDGFFVMLENWLDRFGRAT